MTNRTKPHIAVALIAGVLAVSLSGCGSQSQDAPVASLSEDVPVASAPPAGSGGATPDGAQTQADATTRQENARPQRRLDDSPEREQALWNAYNQCLLDHGAERNDERQAAAAADGEGGDVIVVAEPVPGTAVTACEDVLPLVPPELDPAINPDYHDDFVAWVTCMQEQGVPVHLTQDTGDPTLPSWTYDQDATVPDDAAAIQDDCQAAAFGGQE